MRQLNRMLLSQRCTLLLVMGLLIGSVHCYRSNLEQSSFCQAQMARHFCSSAHGDMLAGNIFKRAWMQADMEL
jgi:hypothetical protein